LNTALEVLTELYDASEIPLIAPMKPRLVGINTRDLKTFIVDPLRPQRIAESVDWECTLVHESGIKTKADAALTVDAGFTGILVGETLVRNPGLTRELLDAQGDEPNQKRIGFWKSMDKPGLKVKICGLCREEDVRFCASLKPDLLGFIFAKSPRKADVKVLEQTRDISIPKVLVVVPGESSEQRDLLNQAIDLIQRGLAQALQLHCASAEQMAFVPRDIPVPYYIALGMETKEDVIAGEALGGPRLLLDAKKGSRFRWIGVEGFFRNWWIFPGSASRYGLLAGYPVKILRKSSINSSRSWWIFQVHWSRLPERKTRLRCKSFLN
jgi:phosphoribosylanthranilate isomerase